MTDYATYYALIEKPFFAPEPWVFGLAWGIIYPLIAIAFVWALYLVWQGRLSEQIAILFVLNLVANVLFTPIQLSYPGTILPTLTIFAVIGTLGVLQWKLWHAQKFIFLLLLPYLLWGAFATVLQCTIYVMSVLR